jgi:predicted phosphodiesterase
MQRTEGGAMSVVAILSDIHGNLPALEAVLADADRMNCETIWSLGDIVGYGGSPNECLDLLRNRGTISVMGNHDAAVVGDEDLFFFHPAARAAVEWTQQRLSMSNLKFLKALPDRRLCLEKYLLVHGAPDNRSRYLATPSELFTEACLLRSAGEAEVCFYGHTHIPMMSNEDNVWIDDLGRRHIETYESYFVNPGSVGQPRDDNPKAAWLRLDTEASCLEFRRVDYDVEQAQALIRAACLPGQLADRLEVGQ